MSGHATQNNPQRQEEMGFSAERYQNLAGIMDKDEGTAIFRRFGDLNMLNLLSLQAELEKLRNDFKALCVQVPLENKNGIQGYVARYSLPARQQQQEAEDIRKRKNSERLEMQIRIRETLKDYSEPGFLFLFF